MTRFPLPRRRVYWNPKECRFYVGWRWLRWSWGIKAANGRGRVTTNVAEQLVWKARRDAAEASAAAARGSFSSPRQATNEGSNSPG